MRRNRSRPGRRCGARSTAPANSSSACSARAPRSSDHGRRQQSNELPGAGRFITFEGGEGSGKSTQIKTLAERLDAAKLRAIVTREPGGSPGAEIIRHLRAVRHGQAARARGGNAAVCGRARRSCAHASSSRRWSQGIWVLCDRFSDSTRAYQGRLGKVAPGVLNAMERVTIGDLKPDLTIILDVPVEVGHAARRRAARQRRARPVRGRGHQISSGPARGLSADRGRRAAALRADRCQRRRRHGRRERLGRGARPPVRSVPPGGQHSHERPQGRAGHRGPASARNHRRCSGIARPRRRCWMPIAAGAFRMPG